MRYEIQVSDGRKIIQKHMYDNYLSALDALDTFTDKYGHRYTITFKDKNPFAPKG